jgi:hypothetical protein
VVPGSRVLQFSDVTLISRLSSTVFSGAQLKHS